MSAALIAEGPRPIAAVGRSNPATKNLNPRTLLRWAQRGVRGVKLESLQVGGRLMSTAAALDRFLAALNAGPEPAPSAPRSPAERRRASAAAGEELERLGV
ncbi:DUF1580 domain-containing protein [Gemmata sp.]|uniref:DUF1580 domain-containing protein n=1 Tax=Gemmata sp. TaxID=1914242 RepID=UPI003F701471